MFAAEVADLVGEDQIIALFAGNYHDLGKWQDLSVFQKSGELTSSQMKAVRLHPGLGADAVRGLLEGCLDPLSLEEVVKAIRFHHKRLGGKGYPEGSEEPTIYAQIVGAADLIDVFLNGKERPYLDNDPKTFKEMEKEIQEEGFSSSVVAGAKALLRDLFNETHQGNNILRAQVF
jgi:HD-GYP domain-containing protein (c-di-GMP phosphodiesterase class II)